MSVQITRASRAAFDGMLNDINYSVPRRVRNYELVEFMIETVCTGFDLRRDDFQGIAGLKDVTGKVKPRIIAKRYFAQVEQIQSLVNAGITDSRRKVTNEQVVELLFELLFTRINLLQEKYTAGLKSLGDLERRVRKDIG